jgi:hypothetical protein
MISKEQIKSEIEKVPEERLDELYMLVKNYSRPAFSSDGPSFMAKLRSVEIEGPDDFAKNIDLYLSGEKTID